MCSVLSTSKGEVFALLSTSCGPGGGTRTHRRIAHASSLTVSPGGEWPAAVATGPAT